MIVAKILPQYFAYTDCTVSANTLSGKLFWEKFFCANCTIGVPQLNIAINILNVT